MTERNYLAEREAKRKREEEELEAVKTFHRFLQGEIPKGVTVRRFKRMNPAQAFTVIWFLQEVCHLLSDRFEMCSNCEEMYDSYGEGHYYERRRQHYCGSCDPLYEDEEDE